MFLIFLQILVPVILITVFTGLIFLILAAPLFPNVFGPIALPFQQLLNNAAAGAGAGAGAGGRSYDGTEANATTIPWEVLNSVSIVFHFNFYNYF